MCNSFMEIFIATLEGLQKEERYISRAHFYGAI
jgi:hypothetical protein